MTAYQLAIFLHVSSAIGLFAALVLEGVSQRRLQVSTSHEQAREWTWLWRVLPAVGLPSLLGVLATGVYLATVRAAWELVWAQLAVPLLVATVIAGALSGPRRTGLAAALAQGSGPMDDALVARLRHPIFSASWRFRAAVSTGLVFAMTVKPGDALGYALVAAFVGMGVVWGALAWWRSPAAAAAARPR